MGRRWEERWGQQSQVFPSSPKVTCCGPGDPSAAFEERSSHLSLSPGPQKSSSTPNVSSTSSSGGWGSGAGWKSHLPLAITQLHWEGDPPWELSSEELTILFNTKIKSQCWWHRDEQLCNPPAQLGASPSEKKHPEHKDLGFLDGKMEGKEPWRGQGSQGKGEPSTRNTQSHTKTSLHSQEQKVKSSQRRFPRENGVIFLIL